MCLAGRFSVVTESGSWLDLHHRAWGSVRLFSYLDTAILDPVPIKRDVASCAGSQNPPRPPCTRPFVHPRILHLQPEYQMSGRHRCVSMIGFALYCRPHPHLIRFTKGYPNALKRLAASNCLPTIQVARLLD